MTNPLLAPSSLPFQLPDYARISDDDFREAIEVGMAEQTAALSAIASDGSAPTVDNVLSAWEHSDATLKRALHAFWVAKSADRNDARDAIEQEFAPRLASHSDRILLDPDLHSRLQALRDAADTGEVTLDEEDSYNLDERLREFRRNGITLDNAAQDRLRAINSRLAELTTRFEQLLVAGRNAGGVLVTDEDELAGLSEEEKERLRSAAAREGREGFLVDLVNTTGQPVLDSLEHRGLRERIHRASVGRGTGGEHDTRPLIIEIVRLRAERAALLGYENHAAWVAEDGCARSSAAVAELLSRVAPGARLLAEREADDLQGLLEEMNPSARFEPWDWQFLAARLAARRAVDHDALRQYLEFDRVLERGVFAAATRLYGITFHERPDLVGYTEQTRTFEVRESDGSPLGALLLDAYTRPTKQGGAWMTSLVDQSHLLGDRPVVTNTCNVPPPTPGSPSLMTWDSVITLFHEFGHALHGLLSDVKYPSRSGTNTPRDFVEYPSQVNEIWAWHPELLQDYARHHTTGEPLPQDVRNRLLASRTEGAGHATFELVSAMVLDQAWHAASADELPQAPEQVEGFERVALESAGLWFTLVPPRYRSTYFSHIFAGGYAAAYYAYLWSQVMDADTVAWFRDNGDLGRGSGEHFRRRLLARGGSVDAMVAYREFRGADPDVGHLLERLGLH